MTLKISKDFFLPRLLFAIIVMGSLALALFFSFNPRGVWLDEAALGVNIMKLSWIELTKDLQYNQSAPILYLWFSKLCGEVFGYSDFTLRIPSIIGFFLLLGVLWKWVATYKEQKVFTLSVLILFVSNNLFFHYAFELKQYIYDVVFITWFSLIALKQERPSLATTGIFITLSWLSNVALLFSPFYLLLLIFTTSSSIRNFPNIKLDLGKRELLLMSLILLNMAIYYGLFIKGNSVRSAMIDYWRDDFFLHSSSSPQKWLAEHGFRFLADVIPDYEGKKGWHVLLISFTLLLASIIGMFRMKKGQVLLLLLPFGYHLLLSALKLYPFGTGRLTMYLIWVFILLFAFSLVHLKFNFTSKWSNYAAIVLFVLVASLRIDHLRQQQFVHPNQPVNRLELKMINEFGAEPNKGEVVYYLGSIQKMINYYSLQYQLNGNNPFLSGFQTVSSFGWSKNQILEDIKRSSPACIYLVTAHSSWLLDEYNRNSQVNILGYQLYKSEYDNGLLVSKYFKKGL